MRLRGVGARCECEVKPEAVFDLSLCSLCCTEKHEGAASVLIFVNFMKLLTQ